MNGNGKMRLTVLDFDGTCTFVDKEGEGFVHALIATLSGITGWSENAVRAKYTEAERLVLRDADKHGWVIDGKAVAPASCDPYLRSKPVARMIMEAAGMREGEILAAERDLNGPLFKTHYSKSGIALRDGLHEALWRLMRERNHQLVIITNSDTDAVRAKLATLPRTGHFNVQDVKVIGGAKKYVLGELNVVAETMEMPGLITRPVYLRRPHYFEKLDEARRTAGVERWEDVTVVGDIFELDGALPLALGCRFGLATGTYTPSYEIEFFQFHPRAGILHAMHVITEFALHR